MGISVRIHQYVQKREALLQSAILCCTKSHTLPLLKYAFSKISTLKLTEQV